MTTHGLHVWLIEFLLKLGKDAPKLIWSKTDGPNQRPGIANDPDEDDDEVSTVNESPPSTVWLSW